MYTGGHCDIGGYKEGVDVAIQLTHAQTLLWIGTSFKEGGGARLHLIAALPPAHTRRFHIVQVSGCMLEAWLLVSAHAIVTSTPSL